MLPVSSWKPNGNLCKVPPAVWELASGRHLHCLVNGLLWYCTTRLYWSQSSIKLCFTLFSFYILYISIVNSSIDSEYLFLSHFCKAGKCSFCVFLLVASNYLFTLVQCGILIVPVSCDCSVSLCGNPDVFMYYKVNCGDRFVCVLTFLKKCLDKSRHTCKCTSECRCAGVFVVKWGWNKSISQ